jgi:Outer membrane protein beta-barrel domain
MRYKIFFTLLITIFVLPSAARAQSRTEEHRFEAGAVFTVLDMRDATGGKSGGVGVRFTYNFHEYAAFDSELVHYPENPSGNYGETQGLFGIRAGKRFGKAPVGLFVKARPGFVKLGNDVTRYNPAFEETRFALDLGGVLELYPSERTIVRVDYGDTLVSFGDTAINSATRPPRRLGTTHNTQASIGFGFRF